MLVNGKLTEFFQCNVGVRQGCPMSPILFSLFTSDLMQALGNCGVWLENYFVSGLMFADDIVLFSEDKEGLQTAMDRLHTYCSEWKLRVNKNKTKVVAFSNSPKKELELRYNGSTLEQVNSFKYLGLVLSRTGSFTVTVDTLCKSALRVLHMLRCMSQSAGISSPDILYSLYASIVQPVIEYGSEIWGNKQFMEVERFNLKFSKELLALPHNAASNAVYGETGTFPCWLRSYSRVIDYYRRIIEGQAPPLVVDALNVSQQTHGRRSWWNQLQNILSTFDMAPAGILLSKSECILKLQEDFIYEWEKQLWSDTRKMGGNKLRLYREFKSTFAWENYLSWVTIRAHRQGRSYGRAW